ncbi:MAG: diguanylate cyclase, partial [Spirochaetales bacterium]|nr:diguanylate cyclase [Spirochaetales bacterium]
MPLLKMIRITALYFILAFSIIAGIFNLRIILNYNSLMPLIFILLFLFIEIFTLIYFIVKKNLLFAQKLAVAGILMMMTQTIIDGGGYYGLGIFYFIIIFSALHLFLNYKLSIFILIYFFIGITVRLLWGNFLPESIYNNEVLINRFILIFGMSSGIGLLSITINELLTKHLYTLAYTNPITEMPNRYKFMQFLDESISGSTKNIGFSLIGFKILDFNRFIANLGNKNGDIIITEVSNKIKSVIPTDSFIAHWSNSIFLIIIRSVSDNKIRKINNSFFQCLQNPFIVDNGEAYLQAISAISKYPDDSNTPDKIIENVLALLDNNKIKPGKTFFYSKLYKEQEEKRLKLVYLLNNVNMDTDFHLVYQPKIRLSDKKCIGAEVLLRWESHESGLISP